MDGEVILILPAQELLADFLADLQRLFRRDLPRLKAHNKVLGEDGASSCPECCDLSKILARLKRIAAAQVGGDQAGMVGLIFIGNVGYGFSSCS